jgi:hypothetical protein
MYSSLPSRLHHRTSIRVYTLLANYRQPISMRSDLILDPCTLEQLLAALNVAARSRTTSSMADLDDFFSTPSQSPDRIEVTEVDTTDGINDHPDEKVTSSEIVTPLRTRNGPGCIYTTKSGCDVADTFDVLPQELKDSSS